MKLNMMKRHLFFAVLTAAFTTFSAMSDNGILTSIPFSGDDLSPVAYCQEGEDYLVERFYSSNSHVYNIYNSSWQKVHTVTDFVEGVALIGSANQSYQGEDDFLFSQTLLNDDAEFEYMVEKTIVVDEGGYSDEQICGIRIMQTNGNCLADITFSTVGEILEAPRFILLKDKLYLFFTYDSIAYLYEVNREGSSNVLKLVAENKNVAGYPNPVQRGEVYTVDGGKRSLKNAVVNVVRLDGSLVQSFSTGNNDKAEIETSQMNSGVYVYTAVRGNKVVASGRFVVE